MIYVLDHGSLTRIVVVGRGSTGKSNSQNPSSVICRGLQKLISHDRGCVSGKQIQNLRDILEDPAKPGIYRWDYLDGYEGEDKNSLDKHPDLQEKVRRVIEQGHIDPEDWNGVNSLIHEFKLNY